MTSDFDHMIISLLGTQCDSLRTAPSQTLQIQGWEVRNVSFTAGGRALNEESESLHKTLQVIHSGSSFTTRGKSAKEPSGFQHPAGRHRGHSVEVGNERRENFLDEYANILRGMSNGKINGATSSRAASNQVRTTSQPGTTSPK
jgi:hypothetical protein